MPGLLAVKIMRGALQSTTNVLDDREAQERYINNPTRTLRSHQ